MEQVGPRKLQVESKRPWTSNLLNVVYMAFHLQLIALCLSAFGYVQSNIDINVSY